MSTNKSNNEGWEVEFRKRFLNVTMRPDYYADIEQFIQHALNQQRGDLIMKIKKKIESEFPVHEEYKDLFLDENIEMKKLYEFLTKLEK